MSGVSKEEMFCHIIEIIETYDPLDEIPTCTDAWESAPTVEKDTSLFIRTIIEEVIHSKGKLMGENVVEH